MCPLPQHPPPLSPLTLPLHLRAATAADRSHAAAAIRDIGRLDRIQRRCLAVARGLRAEHDRRLLLRPHPAPAPAPAPAAPAPASTAGDGDAGTPPRAPKRSSKRSRDAAAAAAAASESPAAADGAATPPLWVDPPESLTQCQQRLEGASRAAEYAAVPDAVLVAALHRHTDQALRLGRQKECLAARALAYLRAVYRRVAHFRVPPR